MNLLKDFFLKNWIYGFIIIFCLTPIFWFINKGYVLINGVDTNFPLDPLLWFSRRFYVWNNIENGGFDFSSSTSGLFFHFIQVIPYQIGLNLQNTEIFSLVFWFSALVLSAFFLAKTILPHSRLSQIIFVVIYSFNLYLFNTWENVKVSNLALYTSLPFALSILILFYTRKLSLKKCFLYSVFLGILSSGSGINPAYFFTIILGLIIFVGVVGLVERNWTALKDVSIGFLTILLTCLLINAFWILPTANYLFFSDKQLTNLSDIGFTNWVDSLSENTSLVNVLRLQGAWDWYAFDGQTGQPLYIPYANRYFSFLPFVIYSYLFPLLAILSFVFAKRWGNERQYLYPVLGAYLLLGVFLGAGSHEPTGTLYRVVASHIPLFSFFRSPWYIFTPLVTLAYAGLISLLFLKLCTIVSLKKDTINVFSYKGLQKRQLISSGLFFLFISMHLVYSYPLILGRIFRPDRADGFFIKYPNYVWEAKNWLGSDKNTINGRVVSYPDEELESFEWGYKGPGLLINLFSDQEFLSPSFNITNRNLSELLSGFYKNIKRNEIDSALKTLSYLGSNTIFYKKDTYSLSPSLEVIEKMSNQRQDFDKWSFLSYDNNSSPKIYSPRNIVSSASGSASLSMLLPIIDKQSLIVQNQDKRIKNLSFSDKKIPYFEEADNTVNKKTPKTDSEEMKIGIPENGSYFLLLEKYGINDLSQLEIRIDGIKIDQTVSKETDSSYLLGPIQLSKGNRLISIKLNTVNNLINNKTLENDSEIQALRREDLPQDLSKTYVAFSSRDTKKIVPINVEGFDPYSRYIFSFDYKYIYGRSPIIEMIQSNEDSVVKSSPSIFGTSMDWEHSKITIDPVQTNSNIKISLVLPPNTFGGKSKSYIENLKLERILDNRLFILEDLDKKSILVPSSPDIKFTKINPTEYHVEASGVKDGYYLVFLENFSSDWAIKSNDILGKAVHFNANGFANGWYIPGGSEKQKITIYYKPQQYFVAGGIITITTLLCALVVLLLPLFRLSLKKSMIFEKENNSKTNVSGTFAEQKISIKENKNE